MLFANALPGQGSLLGRAEAWDGGISQPPPWDDATLAPGGSWPSLTLYLGHLTCPDGPICPMLAPEYISATPQMAALGSGLGHLAFDWGVPV